jgi:hypothetical protein
MIDVEDIKNLDELLEMRADLNFFINKKIVAEIYKENGQEAIELETDRTLARQLLVKVTRRIAELNRRAKKTGSVPRLPVPST